MPGGGDRRLWESTGRMGGQRRAVEERWRWRDDIGEGERTGKRGRERRRMGSSLKSIEIIELIRDENDERDIER